MLRVVVRQHNDTARIVAALHNVVEDSGACISDLEKSGYNREIRNAVDCLTRRAGEPYDEMITRVAGNPIARQIKLADLEDNMDRRRMTGGEEAKQRLARYAAARDRLLAT